MKHLLGPIRVAVISAGMLLGASAWADTKPSDTKPSADAKTDPKAKPKKAGQTEELKKAVDELTKEYKDYVAKPDANSLRTASDYFKGQLPPDTTVEDILAVCNGNTISGSVGLQAYVKWQLLSACPIKFEGEQIKLATQALGKAPQMVPSIGGTQQVKSQLDRAIQGKKVSEVPSDVLEGFKKEQQKVDDVNDPIAGYRRALWTRLPMSYDTLLMGFQELVMRLNAGIDGQKLKRECAMLATDAKSWATVDAKEGQVPQLLAAVQKLKTYKAPTTYYYANVGNDATKPAKWGTFPIDFGKNFDELETALKDISSGSGGLKFKDDGKDTKKK